MVDLLSSSKFPPPNGTEVLNAVHLEAERRQPELPLLRMAAEPIGKKYDIPLGDYIVLGTKIEIVLGVLNEHSMS